MNRELNMQVRHTMLSQKLKEALEEGGYDTIVVGLYNSFNGKKYQYVTGRALHVAGIMSWIWEKLGLDRESNSCNEDAVFEFSSSDLKDEKP